MDHNRVDAPPTEEEVRAWLRGDKQGCPCCGPDADTFYDSFDCEDWTVWQDASCNRCKARWQCVFRLATIDVGMGDGPEFSVRPKTDELVAIADSWNGVVIEDESPNRSNLLDGIEELRTLAREAKEE